MSTTLARLNVLIGADTREFQGAVDGVRGKLGQLRNEATKSRSVVALMAGAAGFGLASKPVLALGSAVEETASKFATVFGDSADHVGSDGCASSESRPVDHHAPKETASDEYEESPPRDMTGLQRQMSFGPSGPADTAFSVTLTTGVRTEY